MTGWHIDLTVKRVEPEPDTSETSVAFDVTTVARVDGEYDDPAMVGALLRAVADRVDPPRHVMRRGTPAERGGMLTVTDPAPGSGPVADVGAVVDALHWREAQRRQIPG